MIDSQQFNQQFTDGASPALESSYLFYGQTPFLSDENAQVLVKYAKKNGFTQREIFYIDNRTKFDPITLALKSPGLFDPKKIIELRIDTEKPTKRIGQQLADITQHGSPNLLIIQAGDLPYRVQKEKWFGDIQKTATAVVAKPIYAKQLPNWIHQRTSQLRVQLDTPALQMIMRFSQGNLLWTNQILMQLSHSDYPQPINETVIETMLADMSVFHIEDLTRALLGKQQDAIHITQKLAQENESLVFITTVLYREFNTLHQITESGLPFAQACKQLNIWQSKQAPYQTATKLYKPEQFFNTLRQLAKLDKINKGLDKGDGWLHLSQLVGKLVTT